MPNSRGKSLEIQERDLEIHEPILSLKGVDSPGLKGGPEVLDLKVLTA